MVGFLLVSFIRNHYGLNRLWRLCWQETLTGHKTFNQSMNQSFSVYIHLYIMASQLLLTSAEWLQHSSSPWKLICRPSLLPASRIWRVWATSNTPFSQNTSILSTWSTPIAILDARAGIWLVRISLVASSAVLPLKEPHICNLISCQCQYICEHSLLFMIQETRFSNERSISDWGGSKTLKSLQWRLRILLILLETAQFSTIDNYHKGCFTQIRKEVIHGYWRMFL